MIVLLAASKGGSESTVDWAAIVAAAGAIIVAFFNWHGSRNGAKAAEQNGKAIKDLIDFHKSYKESFDQYFNGVLKQLSRLQDTLARTLRALTQVAPQQSQARKGASQGRGRR